MNDPWDRRLYAPVAHPDRDMYRVPVWVSDDEIAIGLGNDTYRYYSHDNVPTKIKALLTMIHAFPPEDRPSWAINPNSAYVAMNEKQKDIGWRVTDELYILVMDFDFLEECYVKGVGNG